MSCMSQWEDLNTIDVPLLCELSSTNVTLLTTPLHPNKGDSSTQPTPRAALRATEYNVFTRDSHGRAESAHSLENYIWKEFSDFSSKITQKPRSERGSRIVGAKLRCFMFFIQLVISCKSAGSADSDFPALTLSSTHCLQFGEKMRIPEHW